MNTTIYYMSLYAFIVIVCLVGAYLHLVPTDILIAAISIVVGHGTGLFSPAPDGTTTKVASNG